MRLDKYLADCGVATRSEIKKMIRGGAVTVAGISKPRPETQVDAETAQISVHGELISYRRFIYLMLHKPQGVLSATRDGRLPTVLHLVPEEYLSFSPFPVGRLDLDTEGLCLLTNDGQLAHRLLSPAHHVPKTYYAKIRGEVTGEDVARFAEGVTLEDGYHTRPAQLKVLECGATSVIEVTITEGKYHQIKRMFLAVGKEVVYLKRLRMHTLELDPSLPPGALRELTEEELAQLTGTIDHVQCDKGEMEDDR